jgi:hypothetical protein
VELRRAKKEKILLVWVGLGAERGERRALRESKVFF